MNSRTSWRPCRRYGSYRSSRSAGEGSCPAGSWSAAAGFPFARSRYYRVFRTVELQNTFYDLPDTSYAEKLRSEAPEGFIFNMKAWQALTHPLSSPTWRRARRKPQGDASRIGLLRPTMENMEAWRMVRGFAETLGARVVVLQTPPSFRYSPEAEAWVRKFFEAVGPRGLSFALAWEPRGDWREHQEALRRILCSTGVVHAVDPFKADPVICDGQRVVYMRLHGRGRGEVNYRYRYTESDYAELTEMLTRLLDMYGRIEEVYVMFNNVYMARDAVGFREYAAKHGLDIC